MKVVALDPSLRGFGVYAVRDGVESSQVKRIPQAVGRLDALGRLAHWLGSLSAQGWDLCTVEDYAYSGGLPKGQNSRAVTILAEVGGLARALFRARGVPVIEVPIGTWKSVTGLSMKKGTALHESNYLNAVSSLFDKRFGSTDEADAFLMYHTVKKCGLEPSRIEGAARIKQQLEDLKINAQEM